MDKPISVVQRFRAWLESKMSKENLRKSKRGEEEERRKEGEKERNKERTKTEAIN